MSTPDQSTKEQDRHTCEAALRGGSTWSRYTYACGKTAKVEREGHWYCGTHDPVAVSERRARLDAKQDAKFAERSARFRLEQAAPELLAALKTLLAMDAVRNLCDEGPYYEGWQSDELITAISAGDAAIAKAEGR